MPPAQEKVTSKCYAETNCDKQPDWLAKPNVVWPASANNQVTAGGKTYTKDEASRKTWFAASSYYA